MIQSRIEPGAAFLHFRNLNGKAIRRGLARYREQHEHILALRSGDPDSHGDRTRLAAFSLVALS
jgi:hypothetical protein